MNGPQTFLSVKDCTDKAINMLSVMETVVCSKFGRKGEHSAVTYGQMFSSPFTMNFSRYPPDNQLISAQISIY